MSISIPSPASNRQRLALLVDGDADTRRMYAEYLRMSSGWAVEEAADGREALAKAISSRPAVVVTETRLPGKQWDYFECGAACGTFQYRQRTRKLRKV